MSKSYFGITSKTLVSVEEWGEWPGLTSCWKTKHELADIYTLLTYRWTLSKLSLEVRKGKHIRNGIPCNPLQYIKDNSLFNYTRTSMKHLLCTCPLVRRSPTSPETHNLTDFNELGEGGDMFYKHCLSFFSLKLFVMHEKFYIQYKNG